MLVSGTPALARSLDELIPPSLGATLERLDLISRKIFPGKLAGERRSKRRGRSVEFEDFRNYVAGDDLRHIDWNVLARLDKLFVKVFQEDEDLSFHLILDASWSMNAGNLNKLAYAQRLAMSLGYLALIKRNRVYAWLGTSGERGYRALSPIRGRRAIPRLAAFLIDELREVATSPPASADLTPVTRAAARSGGGRGIAIVISDFLSPDGYEAALRDLASREDLDVVCAHVLSPGELDPTIERRSDGSTVLAGDVRLIDAETGASAEITATPKLLAKYKQDMATYIDRVRSYCRARDMKYLQLSTDQPVEEVVLREMRRRQVVG